MGATGQQLVERSLRRLGNHSISVYGQLLVDCTNEALIDLASGRDFQDFRDYQKTATYNVPAGTGGRQSISLTNWASDIWTPVHWHDETNDRPLTVANRGVREIYSDTSSSPSTEVNRYALWGNNLLIVPALSGVTEVVLLYISTTAQLSITGSTVSGSSLLPVEFDEGVILGACARASLTINPGLEPIFTKRLDRWGRHRFSPAEADLFNQQLTFGPKVER
jgi:hypothetical protein